MKKFYLVCISSLLLVLGACGNQEPEAESGEVEEQETVVEETEETEESEESEVEDETEDDSEEDSESDAEGDVENDEAEEVNKEQSGELEELEEYEMLEDNIDLTEYTPDVKEDNSHKRIILFKNGKNNEKYKSIYIKKENRLKIIEFDEGLIYNEKI